MKKGLEKRTQEGRNETKKKDNDERGKQGANYSR